jgi:cyclase
MLTRRILACLDVRDGRVVKGVRFAGHRDMGDVVDLARRHRDAGADELVLYDIAASPRGTCADPAWVARVARAIDIPFCVAGGIRTVAQARTLLNAGADKVSVNTPALERPALIGELAEAFGTQCVVVGVDSRRDADGEWRVRSHAGDPAAMRALPRRTLDWIAEAQALGAGEIVLNCMDSDGTRDGFDLVQLRAARAVCAVPLVASGGAGRAAHFAAAFRDADADAALAAGALHDGSLDLRALKRALAGAGLPVRLS